jgi:preprotein translocase subunit SecY
MISPMITAVIIMMIIVLMIESTIILNDSNHDSKYENDLKTVTIIECFIIVIKWL